MILHGNVARSASRVRPIGLAPPQFSTTTEHWRSLRRAFELGTWLSRSPLRLDVSLLRSCGPSPAPGFLAQDGFGSRSCPKADHDKARAAAPAAHHRRFPDAPLQLFSLLRSAPGPRRLAGRRGPGYRAFLSGIVELARWKRGADQASNILGTRSCPPVSEPGRLRGQSVVMVPST